MTSGTIQPKCSFYDIALEIAATCTCIMVLFIQKDGILTNNHMATEDFVDGFDVGSALSPSVAPVYFNHILNLQLHVCHNHVRYNHS